MKIKTNLLDGVFLNWAVAVAEGNNVVINPYRFGGISCGIFESQFGYAIKNYHKNWEYVGAISEREEIELRKTATGWCATFERCYADDAKYRFGTGTGANQRLAILRAFVYSKFGDEVTIPDELQRFGEIS